MFARWTQSLAVHGAEVSVPAGEDGLDWEDQVVALVEASLVDATPDEALATVFGYSVFNDLTRGLRLQTRVNGDPVQDARTDQMVYTVGETLSLLSKTFALRAGDLPATGTPSGVGYSRNPPRFLQPGDAVEVDVERLGVVRNTIVGPNARSRLATVDHDAHSTSLA